MLVARGADVRDLEWTTRAAHKRVVAATRAVLGDDAFDQAWREGSVMELEEAVQYALNGQVAEGASACCKAAARSPPSTKGLRPVAKRIRKY